jgi:hypothetical protein
MSRPLIIKIREVITIQCIYIFMDVPKASHVITEPANKIQISISCCVVTQISVENPYQYLFFQSINTDISNNIEILITMKNLQDLLRILKIESQATSIYSKNYP